MPYCQAFGCSNHSSRVKKSMFWFPNPKKKPDLFKKWAVSVKVEKFLDKNYEWSKEHVLCEDHFTSDCFEEDIRAKVMGYQPKKKKLKEDAVPNIFSHRPPPAAPRKLSVKRQQTSDIDEILGEMPSCSDDGQQQQKSLKIRKKGGPYKKRSTLQLVESSTQTDVETMSSGQQTEILYADFACQFPMVIGHTHVLDHTYCAKSNMIQGSKPLDLEGMSSDDVPTDDGYGNVIPSLQKDIEEAQPPVIHSAEDVIEDGVVTLTIEDLPIAQVKSHSEDEESSRHSSSSELEHSINDDPLFQLSDTEGSSNSDEDPEVVTYCKESKFIVFETNLDKLLYSLRCTKCSGCIADVEKSLHGTMVSVIVTCNSGHTVLEWSSQPCIGKAPVGNLLSSAAILFSGNTFTNISHFSKLIGLQFFSDRLFYDIQGKYLIPVVNSYYVNQTKDISQSLGGCDLSLIGDGRCDSPGFSAKYCSYTMMCMETNEIIRSELVQVSQASSSVAMEKMGFIKCLDGILECNAVGLIATDRHTGIRKLMREGYADINHQFDVWHLSKSIGKKLSALAKQRDLTELGPWIPAIKNHFWWSAQNCNENWPLLCEMWTSVVHHVCNVHSWNSCDLYHRCSHNALSPEEERERKWLRPGSKAHEALKGVVFNKLLLKDLQHVTKACHTGSLEVFHNVLLKYCPKRLHFQFPTMQARVQLAILDNNHNCAPRQAVIRNPSTRSLAKGALRYRRAYSKATKQWVLKPIMEGKDYSYLWDLMVAVLQLKQGSVSFEPAPIPELPSNVIAVPCPPLEELVQNRKTRFNREKGSTEPQ